MRMLVGLLPRRVGSDVARRGWQQRGVQAGVPGLSAERTEAALDHIRETLDISRSETSISELPL